MTEASGRKELIYLAHATENKGIAKPLAEGLMRRGIDVWYDEWEIGYGDSLRRRMEEGLGSCTHFIVLLTKESITKPWVNEEIDTGFMRAVDGTAKFIGLRCDLPLESLSPFLRTRFAPKFNLDEDNLEALAGEILDISKKPPLGEKRHAETNQVAANWSPSAFAVAGYFVRNSQFALSHDPIVNYEIIRQATDLSLPDVRLGAHDLENAGLLIVKELVNATRIFPNSNLFTEFDEYFMSWKPKEDAQDLAKYLLNLGTDYADASDVSRVLGWEPRRFNAASAHLVALRVVKPRDIYMGNNLSPCGFFIDDELLRFVRNI